MKIYQIVLLPSIFLAEFGIYHRVLFPSQYHDITKKWKFFDSTEIQGITDSYTNGHAIVFGKEVNYLFISAQRCSAALQLVDDIF